MTIAVAVISPLFDPNDLRKPGHSQPLLSELGERPLGRDVSD
jgi:hypothetical protein